MSRSYKHTPRSGDTKDKFFKKYANRKVRHLPSERCSKKGNAYKKVFCQYDICDYETVGISFQQYWNHSLKRWHNWSWQYEPYPDYDEVLEEYRRWFIRK